MNRLQDLVDDLSERLGRPVLIDDDALQPLAYSRQPQAVDAVRAASILGRGAPADARELLLARGIATARAPLHVPGESAIGMAPRLCVPLRTADARWGYLWIVEDAPLAPEALEAVTRTAALAADELAREAQEHAANRARDAALLAELADGRRPVAELEEELRSRRLLGGRPLVACVMRGEQADGADGLALLRRRLPAGALLAGELDGAPACVAVASPGQLAALGARSVAHALHDAVAAAGGAETRVGQGPPFADVGDAPAAFRRARVALRAATAQQPVADWAVLGADRLVGLLTAEQALADLPEGVGRLLAPEHATLRATLEAYLERAGDVKATAAALSLHRAGLYHRLERIEQLAGVDLRDGDDRLLCQLALRLARLAGR